jgi:ABC-type polysaccharide/polyol phosphate export permease
MTALRSNTTFGQIRFWMLLGWYDILSRYRSTVLGVLWIVIVNGLTVFSIGFVYSSLFGIALEKYFPYLVCGYFFWLYISSCLLEMSDSLTAYRFILHSHPVAPLSVLLRVYARNSIVLLHNIPIALAVLFLFGASPWPAILLIVPNFLIVSVILVCVSGSLAFLSARFRDVQMITTSAIGVLFLITPIIWSPEILAERKYIAFMNPLTHMLDLLRKPLLGETPSAINYQVSAAIAVASLLVFASVYRAFHKKYVFWL